VVLLIAAFVFALLFGAVSVEMLREWNRGGWLSDRVLDPSEGVYAAPSASAAAGVWYCFGVSSASASVSLLALNDELGTSVTGWVIGPLFLLCLPMFAVGLSVWLFMPDALVPKPLRGGPGYLQHKGWL
jgi:hypothetical protein